MHIFMMTRYQYNMFQALTNNYKTTKYTTKFTFIIVLVLLMDCIDKLIVYETNKNIDKNG